MSMSLPLCDLKWTRSARKIFDRHFWCLSYMRSVLHSKTGGFKDLLLRKNIVASHELTKNDCIQKHTSNQNFIIILEINQILFIRQTLGLPWCFFVRNFHILFRAKNWSLTKRNKLRNWGVKIVLDCFDIC